MRYSSSGHVGLPRALTSAGLHFPLQLGCLLSMREWIAGRNDQCPQLGFQFTANKWSVFRGKICIREFTAFATCTQAVTIPPPPASSPELASCRTGGLSPSDTSCHRPPWPPVLLLRVCDSHSSRDPLGVGSHVCPASGLLEVGHVVAWVGASFLAFPGW